MKQDYYELCVTPSSEYDKFADFILTLTDEAIEEKDGSIIVRSEESLENVCFGIELYAKSLEQILKTSIHVDYSIAQKANEDWISAYQKSIKPVSVGSFYIHPSWEEPKDEKINIVIDPALAFGSGHHETTSGCLLMLEKYLPKNSTILDVGCGSGILSIAAAKLGASVDLCDTDELAVKSAKENFTTNKAAFHEAWVGSITDSKKSYDLVVANIIADVLMMLSKELVAALNTGGVLLLSGILDKYASQVKERFAQMQLIEEYTNKEWHTLVLKKKESDESK